MIGESGDHIVIWSATRASPLALPQICTTNTTKKQKTGENYRKILKNLILKLSFKISCVQTQGALDIVVKTQSYASKS